MGLLDELKSREAGARRPGDGVPSWRPAKEREHPEGIEGVIRSVSQVPVREPKPNGPTHDTVVVVEVAGGAQWKVWGSTRDLRDGFDALREEGLLVEGNTLAVKFFGTRKETAKDGTAYTVHSYAVLAESA